jgi:hypothetical protein
MVIFCGNLPQYCFITLAPGVKLRQKTDEAPKTEILIADDTSNNKSNNSSNKSNNSSNNEEDDPILKLRQKLRQIQVLKTFFFFVANFPDR